MFALSVLFNPCCADVRLLDTELNPDATCDRFPERMPFWIRLKEEEIRRELDCICDMPRSRVLTPLKFSLIAPVVFAPKRLPESLLMFRTVRFILLSRLLMALAVPDMSPREAASCNLSIDRSDASTADWVLAIFLSCPAVVRKACAVAEGPVGELESLLTPELIALRSAAVLLKLLAACRRSVESES